MRSRLAAALVALAACAAAAEEAPALVAEGRYRIQVPRLRGAPVIDGKLDDAAWTDAALLEGFTQMEPKDGAPSSERTEVRVGYDHHNLYVAFRCYTADPKTIVAAAMNRDAWLEMEAEDHVEISIDTFHDKQNAFHFVTNPLGAIVDGTIRDDGEDVRWDWDGLWNVATARDETGWTAEFAIPFATLRFPESEKPVFGINFARFIAGRHELSFWKPLTYSRGIWSSRYKVSKYGELSGFEDVSRGNLFDVKPYVALGGARPGLPGQASWQPYRQGGLDLKLPITSSLVADFTVNPDFAEAEADQQQLNLTRFPLLLPEKREFFKEGASLLYFGDRVVDTSNETFEYFSFFQSRTIGLAQNGQVTIPVIGGARVSGKIGDLNVAVLNLTTQDVHDPVAQVDEPLENFSILRMKYELENGTSFGAMGLNKQGGDGSYNRGLGADVNLVATDFLRFGGFFARTLSPGVRGDDLAGSGDVLLQTQHLSFRALYSDIGANFRPDLGYLTRPGIRKLQAVPTLLASPDFLGIKHANLFYDWNFVMDRGWNLLTRLQKAELLVLFNNGYAFALIPRHEFERIDQPFNIYGSINIPSGSYTWRSAFLGLGSDPTAPLSAIVWLDGGEFWGGTKFATRLWLFSRPVAGLSLQAIWDRAGVDLGSVGDFTSHAVSAVATYAFTPRLSTRATVQYATDNTWRTNFLLDWSYMPGANAYLIFNEQRDLNSFVPQPWLNQLTVAIKFSFTWGLAATPRPAGTMRASLGEGEGACALTGEGQAQLAQLSAQGSRPTRSERDQLRALDLCNR